MNSLPKRKLTRLKNYDYSIPGMYFITICVKNRARLLGEIVERGDFDAPHIILSDYGLILDKYVIMPNHFHLILSIPNGSSGTPTPTNSVVSKFISSIKRFCNKEIGEQIWQRSYHDRIIRNNNDYRKIWEYIDTNIIRWEKDCFYT